MSERHDPADEFARFFEDVSEALAEVVEEAPWQRRLAEAILRWEGEGYRTARLDEALHGDSPPEMEPLIHGFARDVERLRRAGAALRELGLDPADPMLLRDPDRAAEAEALLARLQSGGETADSLDDWFLDGARVCWEWVALGDRLVEELD